ncbi:MAG: hypothetical protein D6753_05000 [Planctomycetota bacterium]|nr:MAG: hypothetical protein D6753_05000 [Planctomycetota bacterium]
MGLQSICGWFGCQTGRASGERIRGPGGGASISTDEERFQAGRAMELRARSVTNASGADAGDLTKIREVLRDRAIAREFRRSPMLALHLSSSQDSPTSATLATVNSDSSFNQEIISVSRRPLILGRSAL